MTPIAYLKIAGAAALLGGTYFLGDSNGANRVIARDAKANARIVAAGERLLRSAQAQDTQGATAAVERQTIVREITREVPRIIDRTIYRSACVDGDGIGLLDRAVAAANGEFDAARGPDGGAREVPAPADRD